MEIKGVENKDHFEIYIGGGKLVDVWDKDNPIRYGTIGLISLYTRAAFDEIRTSPPGYFY
jgi:hypothetical protein